MFVFEKRPSPNGIGSKNWVIDQERRVELMCLDRGGPTQRALFLLNAHDKTVAFYATVSAERPASIKSAKADHLHWKIDPEFGRWTQWKGTVYRPAFASDAERLAVSLIAVEALLQYGISGSGARYISRMETVEFRDRIYTREDF